MAAWGSYQLAQVQRARGRLDAAASTSEQARQAAAGPGGAPLPASGPAYAGLAEVAYQRECGLRADDEPVYSREAGHLLLARVLLAQDRPEAARTLLDQLSAAAAAQDRQGSIIEIGALRALALAASGAETAAVTCLAEALALAGPQRYLRVFVDEGPPMAALLSRLIAAQRADRAAADVPLGYLARLQRALDAEAALADPGQDRPPRMHGMVDPLTSRELEVLRMLAAGQPNRAIARELVVSLDTVKKHVGHLLGKLGAANRTQAVARARELGLIP